MKIALGSMSPHQRAVDKARVARGRRRGDAVAGDGADAMSGERAPLYARIHDSEYLHHYGNDEYDNGTWTDKRATHRGLPRILNPDMIEARRSARAWLASQPDADFVRFDFDQTMRMYADRTLRTGAEMTDAECDAVYEIARRSEELTVEWNAQLRRFMQEASDP